MQEGKAEHIFWDIQKMKKTISTMFLLLRTHHHKIKLIIIIIRIINHTEPNQENSIIFSMNRNFNT